MIQYQSTPDFYRDYIEHGWLKDQAAKVHKYISRWRGKNGKWYYSYKSKAQEQVAKLRRNIGEDGQLISRAGDIHRTKDGIYTSEDRRNKSGYQYSNHKTSQGYTHSRADFGDIGSRVNAGTSAGRKRVRKATTIKKFNQRMNRKAFPTTNGGWYTKEYSQNFRTNNKDTKKLNPKLEVTKQGASKVTNKTKAQGYNSSVGSIANNKATNAALRGRANKDRIKNSRTLGKYTYNKYGDEVLGRETVQARKRRVKQIHDEDRKLRSEGWTFIKGIPYPPGYNKKKKK